MTRFALAGRDVTVQLKGLPLGSMHVLQMTSGASSSAT